VEKLSRSATAKRVPRGRFDPKHSDNHGSGGAGGAVAGYVRPFRRGGPSPTPARELCGLQLVYRSPVCTHFRDRSRIVPRRRSTVESLPQKGDVRLIGGSSIRPSLFQLKQVMQR
jgi:hypothetical protein